MSKLIIFILIFSWYQPTLAQAKQNAAGRVTKLFHPPNWYFRPQSYMAPLLTEIMSADIRIDFGFYKPYAYSESVRRKGTFDSINPFGSDTYPITGMDISLGKELPVLGYNRIEEGEANYDLDRSFHYGLFLPIDFHLLWDLGGDSSPIVNTDYRFGSMVKLWYGAKLQGSKAAQKRALGQPDAEPLNDVGWGFRLIPWIHESTHLGDEITIFAANLPNFKRINVSYESWDIAGFYSSVLTRGDLPYYLSVVGGMSSRWGGKSYYENTTINGATVNLTNPAPEFYIGAEMYSFRKNVPWFLSVMTYYRNLYHYDLQTAARSKSIDSKLGFRFSTYSRTGKSFFPHAELYLRFYYGINPHGQFRNEKDFAFLGAGFRIRG